MVNILGSSQVFDLAHSLQEEYSAGFSKFKPDKKLRWLPHLGTVKLELQLVDRTIEASVPPLEAAFIELFSEKGKPGTPFARAFLC